MLPAHDLATPMPTHCLLTLGTSTLAWAHHWPPTGPSQPLNSLTHPRPSPRQTTLLHTGASHNPILSPPLSRRHSQPFSSLRPASSLFLFYSSPRSSANNRRTPGSHQIPTFAFFFLTLLQSPLTFDKRGSCAATTGPPPPRRRSSHSLVNCRHRQPAPKRSLFASLNGRTSRRRRHQLRTTMNLLLSSQPPVFPHQHESPRQSPQRSREYFFFFFVLSRLLRAALACLDSSPSTQTTTLLG